MGLAARFSIEMSRTMSLDRTGARNRNVSETAVVAVLSSLGLVAGAVGAVALWTVVGAIPVGGYAITLGVALVLAVGLPAGIARLGRAVFRVTTATDCDPGIGRDGREISPSVACDD